MKKRDLKDLYIKTVSAEAGVKLKLAPSKYIKWLEEYIIFLKKEGSQNSRHKQAVIEPLALRLVLLHGKLPSANNKEHHDILSEINLIQKSLQIV